MELFDWRNTKEILLEPMGQRWRCPVPEGSLIMDSRWRQEKPVPRFDFLAHVEVKYYSWVDYNITGDNENLKQLVRSPADFRDSTETQYAHVIGEKQILSGEFHPGWSHQDYYGEWDCESSSFEQHQRYYGYLVKHSLDAPIAFVLPEDMKLVEPRKNSLDLYLEKIRKDK